MKSSQLRSFGVSAVPGFSFRPRAEKAAAESVLQVVGRPPRARLTAILPAEHGPASTSPLAPISPLAGRRFSRFAIGFLAGPSFSLPSGTEESTAARIKQLVLRGPATSLTANASAKECAAFPSPLAPVFPLTFVI